MNIMKELDRIVDDFGIPRKPLTPQQTSDRDFNNLIYDDIEYACDLDVTPSREAIDKAIKQLQNMRQDTDPTCPNCNEKDHIVYTDSIEFCTECERPFDAVEAGNWAENTQAEEDRQNIHHDNKYCR